MILLLLLLLLITAFFNCMIKSICMLKSYLQLNLWSDYIPCANIRNGYKFHTSHLTTHFIPPLFHHHALFSIYSLSFLMIFKFKKKKKFLFFIVKILLYISARIC